MYVLTTGGTIEKVYREGSGVVENTESKIDGYLKLLRLPGCDVNVVPAMNKDSLAMIDQDRVLILGMVRAILKEQAAIVGGLRSATQFGRVERMTEADL